ncbi:MAG: hypothetical protein DWC11_06040 [Candidatus Poseidoniales archaeon]|nr:MAG: hypothetical protein DWC11_06040 [Candidatus Poseidoniales archaeon]
MAAERRSKMLDWPRGEVLEVRRGGAEVLEVMLADAATLGLSGGFVARAADGRSGVLALAAGAPIGALLVDEDGALVGEAALASFREILDSGATEVEVHHLPGSMVQEALAMHEGSRFAHGVEHEDVRWWEGRIPAPRRARAPRLPTMAPTVRAPEEVRESMDRTRARLRVDTVDLPPSCVRVVHAAAPDAVKGMAQAWAEAGGCSLVLARRAEDVPEGAVHFWIHEGALNLPAEALGDRPLLIVSVDVHLLSVVMGPDIATSSFGDVLDHGRERGAVHLVHLAEGVLTTPEFTRFSHYGSRLEAEDVAALASDERSLRALSGFDADAVATARERFAPGLVAEPEVAPVIVEAPAVAVIEPEPLPVPEPVVEVEEVREEPLPAASRGPRPAQRVRARRPAPRRTVRKRAFQPPKGDVREAAWPEREARHASDITSDLVRNAPVSDAALPAASVKPRLGVKEVRELPSMPPKVHRPPLARPEAWPEAASPAALERRKMWTSLRLARRYAPSSDQVNVPDAKGLREAAARSQHAFDVDGAHARLFTPKDDVPTANAPKNAPTRRKRSGRKTRRLGGDSDA